MNRVEPESPEAALTKIDHELDRISVRQHKLARRKAILREQATLLRLGASPGFVRLILGGDGS